MQRKERKKAKQSKRVKRRSFQVPESVSEGLNESSWIIGFSVLYWHFYKSN